MRGRAPGAHDVGGRDRLHKPRPKAALCRSAWRVAGCVSAEAFAEASIDNGNHVSAFGRIHPVALEA